MPKMSGGFVGLLNRQKLASLFTTKLYGMSLTNAPTGIISLDKRDKKLNTIHEKSELKLNYESKLLLPIGWLECVRGFRELTAYREK